MRTFTIVGPTEMLDSRFGESKVVRHKSASASNRVSELIIAIGLCAWQRASLARDNRAELRVCDCADLIK